MDKFQEIKNKFENSLYDVTIEEPTMEFDIHWLIEKVEQQNDFIGELREKLGRFEKYWEVAEKQYTELEEKVKYWETNYYLKESLANELNRHNEALIIENMSLKSTNGLRSLRSGGGFNK